MNCRYCKVEILRKDIEQHEQLICDEVPGTCEFQAVGCRRAGVMFCCGQFLIPTLICSYLVIISHQSNERTVLSGGLYGEWRKGGGRHTHLFECR